MEKGFSPLRCGERIETYWILSKITGQVLAGTFDDVDAARRYKAKLPPGDKPWIGCQPRPKWARRRMRETRKETIGQ